MIKVFVGASISDDLDAEEVLYYTLRKNSSEPLEIIPLKPIGNLAGFESGTATPFTNLRWAIPELCNFEGKAIYMDSDIMNFRDIAELWNTDMGGKAILGTTSPVKRKTGPFEYSVALMDCYRMKQYVTPIEELKKTINLHQQMHRGLLGDTGLLDMRWNMMDSISFNQGDAWNIHFTIIPTQPWKVGCQTHPRPELVQTWKTLLAEAKNSVH